MKNTKAIFLLAAMSACLFGASGAGAATTSRAEYSAQKDKIKADYKLANDKCGSLSGNVKDVCHEEAEAARKKALANVEADYKNTPKARRDALEDAADADYSVAKQKCKAMSGNEKDVCMKEAKAAQTKVRADAEAQGKISKAKMDASEDKRDANYKVALEKCDGMSGAAKDQCKTEAKAHYGK